MKGLILCAGRGTRLHPFSYSQPKTLLPVANQPVLLHCIRKLLEVNVKDIGIMIHPSQNQIPEYLGDGSQYGATIRYIRQESLLGIAHAVKIAQPFLQNEPFLLLLGDNLVMDSLSDLIHVFSQSQPDGIVMLSEVEKPQDYGIAEVYEGRLLSVAEKPVQPKSNLAVIGVYLFTNRIFEAITSLQPSSRGEYEITDAIQAMIERGCVIAHSTAHGKYSDVGRIDRWLEANQWMLIQELGNDFSIGKGSVIKDCKIIGPVLIGEGCHLENCRVGPYVSIQDGVQLSNCTHIENSILLENCRLQDIDWKLQNSVFGRSSTVKGDAGKRTGVLIVSDKSSIHFPARGGDGF
ncbi:glucose-1-phosphate thymidylyltransferase [Brevibacillus ruminantium]|uniref:Glucose-1-phosphate thymidylyltransferase n=1 Tax=Brevibacillus ruminantium TaxID=2950604 RepID=A0ABY4WCH6_9BACL|nr:glucose-1-phosphate thymidylyltransferase [Brevibacillus ruminantium]USG63460.1 glucose-1-phosphate thymidylyltransferase [Brevibacillus ruminantium]